MDVVAVSALTTLLALLIIVGLLLVGETNASIVLVIAYLSCAVVGVVWLLWRPTSSG